MRERLVVRRRRPVSKGAASTPCSEGDVFTELMVDQVPPPAESDPGRRRLSSADPEPGVARHQFPPLDQPPPDDWASRQGTRRVCARVRPAAVSHQRRHQHRRPGARLSDGPLHLHMIGAGVTGPPPGPGMEQHENCEAQRAARSAGSPHCRPRPAQRERQAKTDEADAPKVPPPAESDPGRRRLSSADAEPAVARHQFPPLDQPPPDDWACRQGGFVPVYGPLPSPISGDISTGGRAPGSVTARCTCT
ncbi:hypothetical protein FJT64_016468 [Amphibalanus amphitrite]|uniref:Uncharacterized protein n=1 Tax=Amphibalanus amphitrite TaxID=1232801 RepID=A0A6A4WZC6_AMPAM|nr:hypothetical protein FJT64_016468 [Amphibalanus amphitrite]